MPDKEAIDVRILAADLDYGRLFVSFGLSVCAALALIYIQRKMSGPDAFLSLRMRALAAVQTYADHKSHQWSQLSAWASKEYLASRP